MTYLTGAPIVPEVGKFYHLRAGLIAFIHDWHGGRSVHPAASFFKGVLLNGASGQIIWYPNGQYAPGLGVKHELDIMGESVC